MKKQILKHFFFSLLAVSSLLLVAPRVGTAESGGSVVKDLAAVSHLETNKQSDHQTKEMPIAEKISSNILPSTPHFQFPLYGKLRLFGNVRPVSAAYTDRRDYNKRCAIFGIDIFF